VHSPTLGWRPSPGLRGEEFSTNSRGLRGSRELAYAKAPGERRIVVVGDSYTFANRYLYRSGGRRGVYRPVPDDEVYTSRLERALSGVTVVNLGVPGYGTDQQLLYLREEGLRYHPDLVVAAVFVDDLLRAQLSFRDYAKPFFVMEDGRLVLGGVPVPEPSAMAAAEPPPAPLSYLLTLSGAAVREAVFRLAPLGALPVDRLNEAIFDSMRDDVRRHGSRLLVVVIPTEDYDESPHRSERLLVEWGRRAGVPVLPLRDAFSAVASDERGRLFSQHWTPLGHQVAAAAIHEAIRREGLLGAD
jgi:GDSL-like lipase/acylhydrolase family protein